ncbi:MAG: 50S ribosomal protein L13 [Candidatus Thermoplasmatota archaeon]|nr:50S ribosomal protein L13 [Candidatus Thermoplasmatota archaeon]MDI6887419.1 50S ribosomal protein L13 [Candidatus Thermoplasmatota archaeon]
MRVINAENAVLGRLASKVAKLLILGEEVAVVNAEKAIITGSKKRIITEFMQKRKIGYRPRKGPYWPRMPDRILKRAIRGMLPYQKPRGRAALKRLRVYVGLPKEFEKAGLEITEKVLPDKFITLKELSISLGAKL